MKTINKEFQVQEAQENRIFLFSRTLGYGYWLNNYELINLIKSKREKNTM